MKNKNSIHPPSEDLFAYRDGELAPEKRSYLEAHVMGCSACRTLMDQISALESEIRRSTDQAPAGYLEHLHELVRARIAVERTEQVAAPAGAEARATGRAERARGDAASPSRRDRRGEAAKSQRDRGRVEEAPKLPWAAILSTASAAAAVVVVSVILVKQGAFQRTVGPLPPAGREAAQAPTEGFRGAGGGVPADSITASTSAVSRERASGLLTKEEDRDVSSKPDLAADAREKEGKDEAQRRDEIVASQRIAAANEPVEGAAGRTQAEGAPKLMTAPEGAAPSMAKRALSDQQSDLRASGSEFEKLAREFGLPPVWAEGRVREEALERAEPKLRLLYVTGKAGADSARVRLYLAEAARLRYTPGDAALYEEIAHHYRRAIRLAGPDTQIARTAEARLRTLEP